MGSMLVTRPCEYLFVLTKTTPDLLVELDEKENLKECRVAAQELVGSTCTSPSNKVSRMDVQ